MSCNGGTFFLCSFIPCFYMRSNRQECATHTKHTQGDWSLTARHDDGYRKRWVTIQKPPADVATSIKAGHEMSANG